MSSLRELSKIVKKAYNGSKLKAVSFFGNNTDQFTPYPDYGGQVIYVGYFHAPTGDTLQIIHPQGVSSALIFTAAESRLCPLVFKTLFTGPNGSGTFYGYVMQANPTVLEAPQHQQ